MGFISLHDAQIFFVISLELLTGILFSESKSPTPNGMGDQVEFCLLTSPYRTIARRCSRSRAVHSSPGQRTLAIRETSLTLKRLQETLAFPIPDAWAKTLWEYALDAEYIQRLVTGGDCLGGVRLDLTKPWQDLVQNLLEQEVLKI